jgi:two-component system response regulator YesN
LQKNKEGENMYKVLVIDNEPLIRKGLKNIIDWSFMGCNLIGEASNEKDGLVILKKQNPDIIIMDIKLPDNQGIETIKKIKKYSKNSKLIILSAYDNFDYIHKGLKYGAFDFILKPSNINEINGVIKRAVKELDIDKDKEEEIKNLKLMFEKTKPKLIDKLIYDIINRINIDEKDILENIKNLDIEIEKFMFLLVEIENKKITKQDKNKLHHYQNGVVNSFEDVLSESFNTKKVSINDKQFGFIVQNYTGNSLINKEVYKNCKHITEMMNKFFDNKITVFISDEGNGALELSEKYNQCLDIMDYKYYIEDEPVISYKEVILNNNIDLNYKDLKKIHDTIIEAVKVSNTELIRDSVNEYLKTFSKIDNCKDSLIEDNCFKLVEDLNDIDKMFLDGEYDINSANNYLSKIKDHITDNLGNLNEIKSVIVKYAIRITGKVNYFNNKKITLAMRNVIDYINENYYRQITLDNVAQQVYFSSYYVSRLFKKVLGKNFVEYLNEIRVEKAKELLKDVKYKAYEVADMVGIQNAHYFSKIFKKYTGMSPTKFREKM